MRHYSSPIGAIRTHGITEACEYFFSLNMPIELQLDKKNGAGT